MPELTREEILAMPAGYAANVIIDMFMFGIEPAADQIDLYLDDDGWCVNPKTKRRIRTADRLPLPDYTGNISAAMEVFRHLAVEPFAWSIETVNTSNGLQYFVCLWGDGENNKILDWSDQNESLALAIGHVALLAKLTKAEDW